MIPTLLSSFGMDPVFMSHILLRSALAAITAFLLSLTIGSPFIDRMKKWQVGRNTIRNDTPKTHLKKKGTPTMGGLMMLFSLTVSCLLWTNFPNSYLFLVGFITFGYGVIGFVDDYIKTFGKDSRGISARVKIGAEILLSVVVVLVYQHTTSIDIATVIAIPIADISLNLGALFLPFAVVVIMGTGNAVNLTDGLDGLAIVPIAIAALCLGAIAYLVGDGAIAQTINALPVKGSDTLTVFAGSVVGSALGFLCFNASPAKIFMGDTGSLSFGSALGTIAIIVKSSLIFIIIGGIFVVETLSVILQVISFQTTGKRLFIIAPLHHHYEKKGWSENTIVIGFWIVASMLAIVGMGLFIFT